METEIPQTQTRIKNLIKIEKLRARANQVAIGHQTQTRIKNLIKIERH